MDGGKTGSMKRHMKRMLPATIYRILHDFFWILLLGIHYLSVVICAAIAESYAASTACLFAS